MSKYNAIKDKIAQRNQRKSDLNNPIDKLKREAKAYGPRVKEICEVLNEVKDDLSEYLKNNKKAKDKYGCFFDTNYSIHPNFNICLNGVIFSCSINMKGKYDSIYLDDTTWIPGVDVNGKVEVLEVGQDDELPSNQYMLDDWRDFTSNFDAMEEKFYNFVEHVLDED